MLCLVLIYNRATRRRRRRATILKQPYAQKVPSPGCNLNTQAFSFSFTFCASPTVRNIKISLKTLHTPPQLQKEFIFMLMMTVVEKDSHLQRLVPQLKHNE
jgi:hypothetical protein